MNPMLVHHLPPTVILTVLSHDKVFEIGYDDCSTSAYGGFWSIISFNRRVLFDHGFGGIR